MNFEEFQKYRFLAENLEPNQLTGEALQVRNWMEESGRIDEGFWGAVWGWLKTHFSPKANKITKLGNEFADELEKEIRAEYVDSKSLTATMRRNYGGGLSSEIREKMLIAAGDDEDYRKLVELIITEKTYGAKKNVLEELSAKDPEWASSQEGKEITKHIATKHADSVLATSKQYRSLPGANYKSNEAIVNKLQKHFIHERKFREVFKYKDDSEELAKSIAIYLTHASSKGHEISKTKTDAIEIADEFLKIVLDESAKIANELGKDKHDVIDLVKQCMIDFLKKPNPEQLSKAIPTLKEYVSDADDSENTKDKDEVEDGDENSIEDLVTTDNTDVFLSNDSVKQGIKNAEEKADNDSPKEVEKVVDRSVEKFYEANIDEYTKKINAKVEEFNKAPDEKKNFSLNKEGKLDPVTPEIVAKLGKEFSYIYGKIIPYYKGFYGDRSAKSVIADHLFVIYATKKDPDGNLTTEDIDAIVKAIEKNINNKP